MKVPLFALLTELTKLDTSAGLVSKSYVRGKPSGSFAAIVTTFAADGSIPNVAGRVVVISGRASFPELTLSHSVPS